MRPHLENDLRMRHERNVLWRPAPRLAVHEDLYAHARVRREGTKSRPRERLTPRAKQLREPQR